ncbi:MAG: hypothetical protein GY711_21340 [bacterium]|nr:hypothetical protein [bacterium]
MEPGTEHDLAELTIDRSRGSRRRKKGRSKGVLGIALWIVLLAGSLWLFQRPLWSFVDRIRLPAVQVGRVLTRSPGSAAAASGAAANGHVVARLFYDDHAAGLARAEADVLQAEAGAARARADTVSARDAVAQREAQARAAQQALVEAQVEEKLARTEIERIAKLVADGVENERSLERTILFGNGDDVLLPPAGNVQVQDCNVGDGDFAGSNGNVSVDPLFRAPARGDYRLGFGTVCVDAAPGVSGTDVRGAARGNDGDLDLVLAADMGAYELRTLSAPDTVGIGKKLNFELHGEPGSFLTLYLARTTQLPVPDATPFGLRWLPQNQLELIGMHKVLSPHALVHTVYVPNAPGLIGMQFSFQVLARSTAAPAGAAWGDAHTVEFTP